ncbi:MAG: hypothetical protein P0S93_03700 [Candidatus Neptunochlamydia sp.]|nr:hypothetical protein [Candidatus Neptunochlamydia sp.]
MKTGTHTSVTKESLKGACDALAEKISRSKHLYINVEMRKAFTQFITGNIDADIPQNLQKHVNPLKESSDIEEQKASELIPLARHIIRDILPNLLKQSPGLHFGRAKLESYPGKVVPFIGVDTPSNREFGYHYEALCKQFFTAIVKGIDSLQLKDFVEHFTQEANRESLLKKCLLIDTQTAKHFTEMTGYKLSDASSEYGLQKLLEKTQRDLELCIQIEAETALKVVTYYKEYHHSSAQSFPQLVHKLSGMTGTPWNKDGYSKKLGALRADIGAEGQILHTLLMRENTTEVIKTNAPTMESLLSNNTLHPNAIFDMGAIFKNQSNETTAREFLQFFIDKNSPKQGVLFFHCQKGDISSDRLALGRLTRGKWDVEILENSKEQAIINKGVEIDQCLFFLDQRHTTGVDLPFPITSHAITTVSENIQTRTLLQTVMRLRKFCYSQTTDFALLASCYEFMKGESSSKLTIQDILSYALVQEAQKKADSNIQSFIQQIDEVFIESFRSKALLKGHVSPEVVNAYQPFLCPQIKDEPYTQFFCKNALQDPIQYLEQYAKRKVAAFSRCRSLDEDRTHINEQLGKIVAAASKQKSIFPEQVVSSRTLENKQVEAQVQQEMCVEQEQETELSQELLQELQRYQNGTTGQKAEHVKWWGNQDPARAIEDFINAVKKGGSDSSLFISVPDNFKRCSYDPSRKFHLLFPESIFLTTAVQRSYERHLPIFHSSQKIAEFILIIQEDHAYKFVIVSNEEAVFLGKHLDKEGWLVDSSGRFITDCSSKNTLLEDPSICENLVNINIFLGRAAPIENIPQGPTFFHIWLQNGSGKEKDRRDYLAFRSFRQPGLDKLTRLMKSVQFNTVIGGINREKLNPESVPNISNKVEIFLIPEDMIQYICGNQVPFINTDHLSLLNNQELIQSVPLDKIEYLEDRQLKHLSSKQVKKLRGNQLKHLSSKQVRCLSGAQVKRLPTDKIEHLEDGQLKHLSSKQVKELRDNQLKHLSSKQVKRLPTDKIEYLEDDQLKHLIPKQVKGLSDAQVKRLPENQIEHLKDDQLKHLGSKQVKGLSDAQVKRLPTDKIEHLKDDQLKHLGSKQVKWLSNAQVKKLPENQIKYLTVNQLRYLDTYQIQFVSNVSVMLHISYKKSMYMTLSQQTCFFASRVFILLVVTKISMLIYGRAVRYSRKLCSIIKGGTLGK